jgi:oligopeptide transport system substrate-binding protein
MNRIVLILAMVAVCGSMGACDRSATEADLTVQNRSLIRGNGADPGTLDPALAEDIHAFNILVDMYEGLVAESASGELIPGAASHWSISEDGSVYTFEIRGDARWSNGDAVLSMDFVRSMRRLAASETNSSYAFLLEPILHFKDVKNGARTAEELGVTAISESLLEIRLSKPANHFLAVLALPVSFPTHVSGDIQISNGAFSLFDRQIGGPVRLRKNTFYWAADTVSIEEVVYLPIVDPLAEFNMYRAGELDITHNIPTEMIDAAKDEFGDESRISPSSALYYIAFDLSEAPFLDPGLRQALSMTIEREKVSHLLGRGELPAYGIVPPGMSGYQGASYEWGGLSNEDREDSARELYAKAGYSSLSPLKIRYVYDAGGVHERIALAVSAIWRDTLGIETTLEKREWKYFLDTRDRRQDWDVMRFAWFGDYNSPTTFLEIFESSSEQNLSGYANPAYDDLLSQGRAATNLVASNELMRLAEEELLAGYPVIPLYFFVSKHMVKKDIAGFENNAMDRHPSRYISFDN